MGTTAPGPNRRERRDPHLLDDDFGAALVDVDRDEPQACRDDADPAFFDDGLQYGV